MENKNEKDCWNKNQNYLIITLVGFSLENGSEI